MDNLVTYLDNYKELKDYLKEQNLETWEFTESLEFGYVADITCGTFDGANNIFTPWDINNKNLRDTINNVISEFDFDDVETGKPLSINDVIHIYNIFYIKDTQRVYIELD